MLLRHIFDHQSTRYAQVDTIPELYSAVEGSKYRMDTYDSAVFFHNI
jgi:hypothetical protein